MYIVQNIYLKLRKISVKTFVLLFMKLYQILNEFPALNINHYFRTVVENPFNVCVCVFFF